MKKIFTMVGLISSFLFMSTPVYSAMDNGVWSNDLKSLFVNNQAIIMGINIRTFNALDKNGDDIVEIDKGESSGNFISAIERLDELSQLGVNTIHLLPITPVGKVKAMGTAGSLYAISDFSTLNNQLDDKNNKLTVLQEAKKFIAECHKRNIRVMIDLPSCGSYDLYLSRPDLFIKDGAGQPVVPADWTDVRLFRVKNDDGSLNEALFSEYKKFVDMVMLLGADGIRADVATSKPVEFWNKLISYAKNKDNEFLFLAEASESWNEPVAEGYVFTPFDRLLDAGFDGWYGSFFDYKNWKKSNELEKHLKDVSCVIKSFGDKNKQKSVIGSFVTHDELSSTITGGRQFSEQVIWLQSTLPINTYFMDGFQSGDSYQYKYANQKADKTYTDDDYYYVHKGKFDIFNFSRKPAGTDATFQEEIVLANKFKQLAGQIINNGKISFINTNNDKVIAYIINYNFSTILVTLNKDLVYPNSTEFNLKGFDSKKDMVVPFKLDSIPSIKNNKFSFALNPGEVSIMLLSKKGKK